MFSLLWPKLCQQTLGFIAKIIWCGQNLTDLTLMWLKGVVVQGFVWDLKEANLWPLCSSPKGGYHMTKDMLGERGHSGSQILVFPVLSTATRGVLLCSCLTSYCNYSLHANTLLIQPLTILHFSLILTGGNTTPHPGWGGGQALVAVRSSWGLGIAMSI